MGSIIEFLRIDNQVVEMGIITMIKAILCRTLISHTTQTIVIVVIRIDSVTRIADLVEIQKVLIGDDVELFKDEICIVDNNGNRNGYQQRNSGNYVNRANSNRYDNSGNAITLQAVVDEPSSLEAVREARKRFLESFTDEDSSVTVVNDKLVYVGIFEMHNE